MLKATGLEVVQHHGPQLPVLGGQIKAILLAAMQHQWPHQPLQLLEMAGATGLPEATSPLLAPMPLTEHLLEGPLIAGQGMTDRG